MTSTQLRALPRRAAAADRALDDHSHTLLLKPRAVEFSETARFVVSETPPGISASISTVTRPVALEILESIRKTRNLTKDRFLQLYEGLVVDHAWHSGSLHRRRKTVAESYGVFQVALQDLVLTLGPNTSAGDAYDTLLQHLSNASHVGPNIISEILHSYDSRRFAVMNQNSIAGIAMAGLTQFPTRPSKASVTPQLYEEFCDGAEIVRAGLGLNDFAELDALFNYAYW